MNEITYPKYFRELMGGKTYFDDFVWDDVKQNFIPIAANEVNLDVALFYHVIRVFPPKGYRIFIKDYWAMARFFEPDDLILTNWSEGFRPVPKDAVEDEINIVDINPIIVLRNGV